MEEKTYIMIKPDGFEDTAIVKGFIKRAGFKIIAEKKMHLTEKILRDHYDFLVDKPFFGDIVEFMTSGPVICMIVEGENAVAGMRKIMGATDPSEAEEGTIRRALAKSKQRNIIHGADSPENAEKEIKRFFPELEQKKRIFKFEIVDGNFSIYETRNIKQVILENKKFGFGSLSNGLMTLVCRDDDAPENATKQKTELACIRVIQDTELDSALGIIGYIGDLFAWHGININLFTTDTLYIFFEKKYLGRITRAINAEGHKVK